MTDIHLPAKNEIKVVNNEIVFFFAEFFSIRKIILKTIIGSFDGI